MKRRLNNAGPGEIPVNFLTGNSTAEQKEMVMNNFRSGYYNFCWEQIGRPAEKLLVPGILKKCLETGAAVETRSKQHANDIEAEKTEIVI